MCSVSTVLYLKLNDLPDLGKDYLGSDRLSISVPICHTYSLDLIK